MGKQYVIHKNMEKEPIIYGLVPQYFYLMFFLGIMFLLVIAASILIIGTTGSLSSFSYVVLLFFIFLGIYIFVYIVLKKRSAYTKYNFKKKRKYISNRDLLEYL